MPPFIYHLAGGVYLLPAISVIGATVVLGAVAPSRRIAQLMMVAAVLAIAIVVVSAVAVPWWFAATWAGTILAWLSSGPFKRGKAASFRSTVRLAAFLCTVGAGVTEASHERLQPLPAGRCSTLVVFGNSVTAGLGRRGEMTWPAIVRAAHPIRIVDLSRAGSTVRQALQRATPAVTERGIVLIEIGGNDVIGRTPVAQFGADLESLARVTELADRPVVMFELPRFPFDDGYGIEQRRVAGRHGIRLIPRRCLATILARPGSTFDGIHLSNAGQRELADLVWRVVGPAMGVGGR